MLFDEFCSHQKFCSTNNLKTIFKSTNSKTKPHAVCENPSVLHLLFSGLIPNKYLEDKIFGAILSEEELADKNLAGASELSLEEDDDIDIWLCGEKRAAEINDGFADTVDYIKIVKSGDEYIEGGLTFSGIGEGLSLQLLNSRGEYMSDVDLGYYGDFYLNSLNRGTYYLKVTAPDSGTVGGWIEMYD